MQANHLFDPYASSIDGVDCYFAGMPGYQRNFSRDTILAGIIANDHHLVENQLSISLLHQGKKMDPITGEEPGKIHHEYPGVMVHAPYLSTYNGCDTTALYLIGLEMMLGSKHHDKSVFLPIHHFSIEIALEYIYRHLKDDLFWEFPPQPAKHFSLHTTYWKDSVVPDPDGRDEPIYPVSYAMAQFQVARGMQSAAALLDSDELRQKADHMFKKGIEVFMTKDAFCVEQDRTGRLEQASSDELHILAYLPKKYGEMLPLEGIYERALELITPVGVACTPKKISDHLIDSYHGYVVWIFEQALIHYGARKFGLKDISHATTGCTSYIGTGNELLTMTPTIAPIGNNHQLWSIAAQIYFSEKPSLRQETWL